MREREKRDNREHREPREFKKRACRFCQEKDLRIDYKDGKAIRVYVTEHGKIVPSRMSGLCAYHQREMTTAIKRARILALLPFTLAHQTAAS